MTTVRTFTCDDMFRFSNINLDPLTETYSLAFYLQYMAMWPDYFSVVESTDDKLMGYIMGKAEGSHSDWHGHVTALTVSPVYRRLGLAQQMMNLLENITDAVYKAYYVDLFVRKSNQVAIDMYQKFGYIVYRTVIGYYSGDDEEDAYGNFSLLFSSFLVCLFS
eukprot:Sdes_comp16089_c0_seq2m5297